MNGIRDSRWPARVMPAVMVLATGAVAVVGMVWAAARVFRVGLLMEGKPPSIMELARWIRVG